ncbi:hypothetical protein C1H46_015544 [Malus baccata]|uniref:Uncharacterized protein n=1 Tax=Malus baccata TaxID=106549 RepID=A0A540MJF2_MALBA|nr:hypothetical protein C1H46_015544 [Malus baccata]
MYTCKQIVPTSKRLNDVTKYCQALRITFMHSLPNFSAEVHSPDQEVVIALASNVGDRLCIISVKPCG